MQPKLPLLLAITLYFVSINISFSQKDNGNIFVKGTDEYKMFMAKQSFFAGSYLDAVNKYKEILTNRPSDPSIQFFLGECYFMMEEYNDALDFLEKAKSMKATNEDLSLVLGKTYQMKGMLDKALTELNAYKKLIAGNDKKIAETEIDVYLSQCTVAKQLMAKPVDVQLIPVTELNSPYDDKGPVLLEGDKQMLFTSRRPANSKAKKDEEGDNLYYDDVYESFWNEEKKGWSAPVILRAPINTEFYDACTGVSNDGKMIFLYRNSPTAARGGDLFLSKKSTSGKWKTPAMLPKPINTSYYEDGACISPDGETLYFISERPGGLGRGDIYTSKKTADGWNDPVNLGAPVNSPADENGLYLCPDGKTLFFCSNGAASMGSYDIFRTVLGKDGKWSVPVNLGYPINSIAMETKIVLTADQKTAYIATIRDNGQGARDIYRVDLSAYNVMTGENNPVLKPASLKGKVMSSDSIHTALSVEIRILDKSTGMELNKTKSAADGSYSIEFPGDKPCILEILTEGYQKMRDEIMLPAGKTESKNITLNKNN